MEEDAISHIYYILVIRSLVGVQSSYFHTFFCMGEGLHLAVLRAYYLLCTEELLLEDSGDHMECSDQQYTRQELYCLLLLWTLLPLFDYSEAFLDEHR